eukprot:GDKI01021632.1.p2 GENE.GDKI01021632.1~~GDKI01021632.1.p2  ORF type:complete len:111 (-),score=34.24 GDKI01021632.1:131-463(-)
MGFCNAMLYNHSQTPNCENAFANVMVENDFDPTEEPQKVRVMVVRALSDIQRGEECTFSYGEQWWSDRRWQPLTFNFAKFRQRIAWLEQLEEEDRQRAAQQAGVATAEGR